MFCLVQLCGGASWLILFKAAERSIRLLPKCFNSFDASGLFRSR